jgi:hypothetical protein
MPARFAPRPAAFARAAQRLLARATDERDARRRALGLAGRRDDVAARRPTVNLAALHAAVSASGSFLR